MFSVKRCSLFSASAGAGRSSNVGGKKIGLYRSMALAMISQARIFDSMGSSFGGTKSKSLDTVICCGCGHTALGGDALPLQKHSAIMRSSAALNLPSEDTSLRCTRSLHGCRESIRDTDIPGESNSSFAIDVVCVCSLLTRLDTYDGRKAIVRPIESMSLLSVV